MFVHGKSIIGRRKENQDRYLIYQPNEKITFLAIADGMGGVIGGGIASQIVIETTEKMINKEFPSINAQTDLKPILRNIFLQSQLAVRNKVNEQTSLKGMGSTLCCIFFYGEKYVWGNLGDSRIYHFNSNKFIRITKDHTQIEDYMRDNREKVSDEMILNFGHLLTRTINGGSDEPDIYPVSSSYHTLNDGEGILLCSDGLLLDKNKDENNRFMGCLNESKSIEEFIDSLISDTYQLGSTDNITCIASLNREPV